MPPVSLIRGKFRPLFLEGFRIGPNRLDYQTIMQEKYGEEGLAESKKRVEKKLIPFMLCDRCARPVWGR
ncbi:MAG: hypothetical protein RBG13Loki_0995 [Promethearchaeota archaeon CR_4]|nr:MAG: hypothetical protein RBG13Loki_0995 [Candidatus Lokiarchaeota archaeon CR_4]